MPPKVKSRAPERRNTKPTQVLLHPDERARFEKLAASLGLPLSTWIRMVARQAAGMGGGLP